MCSPALWTAPKRSPNKGRPLPVCVFPLPSSPTSEVLPTTKLVGCMLDCRTSEVGESEQLTAGEVGGCARPLPQLFQSDFLIVSVDFQKYND